MNYTQWYLIVLLLLIGCSRQRNPEKFIATENICNNLFAEKYYAHQGGVYGGELIDVFITDSINFWRYVGRIDEKEYYEFSCDEKNIEIIKVNRRSKSRTSVLTISNQ